MIKGLCIRKLAISLAGCSALASTAYAQDGVTERLKSLSIDQAYAEYVQMDGFSGSGAPPVGLIYYTARLSLANLNYPVDLRYPTAPLTDPEIIAVIRDFEERAGLEIDGSLTMGELERLNSLSALNQFTQLNFAEGLSVSAVLGGEMIFASGSWIMPDIGFPLNYSQITCVISDQVCEELSVSVFAPSLSRLESPASIYSISLQELSYDIQSWQNGIIDALAISSCRQTRLSINTNTELVTLTTQDLDRQGCAVPGSDLRLPPIDGLRVSTLISPMDASSAYFDVIEGAIKPVRGPIFGLFVPPN